MEKFVSFKRLVKIIRQLKGEGKIVGLVSGCFDVIHCGHVEMFKFAKKKVDILVTAVERDDSIRMSKGEGHPMFCFEERVAVLKELECVDYVVEVTYVTKFDSNKIIEDYKEFVNELGVKAIITDTFADMFWKRKKSVAKDLGIKIFLDRRRKEASSSKIIERVMNN